MSTIAAEADFKVPDWGRWVTSYENAPTAMTYYCTLDGRVALGPDAGAAVT